MEKSSRLILCLCAVLLFAVLAGCGNQSMPAATAAPAEEKPAAEAPSVEAPAAEAPQAESVPDPEPAAITDAPALPGPEEFAGEYTCTSIAFGDNVMPLQEDPFTLTIHGDEAEVIGIPELGTAPLKLQYEGVNCFSGRPERMCGCSPCVCWKTEW